LSPHRRVKNQERHIDSGTAAGGGWLVQDLCDMATLTVDGSGLAEVVRTDDDVDTTDAVARQAMRGGEYEIRGDEDALISATTAPAPTGGASGRAGTGAVSAVVMPAETHSAPTSITLRTGFSTWLVGP
jgi:hypothetical protein